MARFEALGSLVRSGPLRSCRFASSTAFRLARSCTVSRLGGQIDFNLAPLVFDLPVIIGLNTEIHNILFMI
jgi:hypothetical protein